MSSVISRSRPVDAEAGEAGTQRHTTARLIYFSSVSGYTHRFVTKLDLPAADTARLPLKTKDPTLLATEPFVLVVPTYGGGDGKGAVPKQVITFLNVPSNRNLIRGVIGAGNTNFSEAYCLAGEIISRKCNVPLMYRFELMGTPEDVTAVREGLERFWR
ncbi:class Ib ribonucleoside-diphosphate reductase assembly flavoprotein NrdI [Citricoccus sp. GCM10030269]|uniref:class Ib ribonucleoside-diphosphate reductase assembly flavoprotein NrdI n=1 Tax=Citricoccus sp. GCM10030269 TaxID=3273388 RepID=UPI003619813B